MPQIKFGQKLSFELVLCKGRATILDSCEPRCFCRRGKGAFPLTLLLSGWVCEQQTSLGNN